MAVVAPMAIWKPFTDPKSTTALTHDIICLHSMVGTFLGSWSWANRDGNPYWHFGLEGDGDLFQCQDLRYRSAANLNGNWHVIPIETADTNEGIWPSPWQGNVAWSRAQIEKLVQLIAWLCVRYNIPPVLIPDTCSGRRGIAYHRQGIDGTYSDGRKAGCEKWSNATGKTCPQDPRIAQLKTEIIPRVKALVTTGSDLGGFLMALSDAKQDEMYTWLRQLVISCVPFHQDANPADARFQVQQLLRRVLPAPTPPIDVDALAAAVAEKVNTVAPEVDLSAVTEAVKRALLEGAGSISPT